MGNMLGNSESTTGIQDLAESYTSRMVAKEQVPLLHTFGTSRKHCNLPQEQSRSAVQRSFSAEQLEPFLRMDSDAAERDSGFSTLPRSVTLASVSNWSADSPRFLRLPKDIPNDSGSFSIAGEEAQELANRCRSITALPSHSAPTCTCVSAETA